MMLIEHEARVGLPRMWEHPKRTRQEDRKSVV